MPSFLTIITSLLLIYCSSLVYRLLTNLSHAKRSNLPYLIIPLDQNSLFWMVASVPLRPWLIKNLPRWIYKRVSLTIYGFEFQERQRPFEQYAAPQGNDKSYLIVTPGLLELSTQDPEIVHEVLRRPRDFQQVEIAELILGKFGPNILISNGDSWTRQRKVIAAVINERISKAVFGESIHQTEGLLDEVTGVDDVAETNRIFDMMKKITINVLSGAGMGISVDWRDEEKPSPGFKMTYIEAIKIIIANIAGTIALPGWFLSNYPGSLPGYRTFKSLGDAVREFPIHTQNMLEHERQRTSAAHGETRSNIMSQMLHASEQGDGETKGIKLLSEEEMQANLFIFTSAGFDTTANTLSYGLVLLTRYPKWQDWIFEEIDRIMPADSSTDLDYTTIFPKAIRIQAFMFEVLRIFAPLIHIPKMTKTEQNIETSRGTFCLPPKTTIYINTVMLHVDPLVWRNLNLAENDERSETDELAFRPTRWINPSAENESQQFFRPPKGSYVPWSAGPRVCPGQKMAQVEFTAIFLKLFQKHRIEAVPLKTASGILETRAEVESRLDARMKDSISVLTLQMNDIYDVENDQNKGLKLRLAKRR